MYKHIIFDFDGTLVNSKDVLLEVFNGLAYKYKYKKLSEEDFNIINNLPMGKRLKMLGIPFYRTFGMKKLQKESNDKYKEYLGVIELFNGIEEVLTKLYKSGYVLSVITSNTADNITRYFNLKNLNVFKYIYSSPGFFGKSRKIKMFLKEQNILQGDALYIGDEIRDIDACHKVGIDIAAVTWGLDNEKILRASEPTYLVNECKDILDILRVFTPEMS